MPDFDFGSESEPDLEPCFDPEVDSEPTHDSPPETAMQLPDRDALRAEINAFDALQQKVAAAMTLVLIRAPGQIRDREWISEQLTHLAAKAHGFEDEPDPEQLACLRGWILENRDTVLNAAFAVFAHTARELQERGVGEELTFGVASHAALTYFASPEEPA